MGYRRVKKIAYTPEVHVKALEYLLGKHIAEIEDSCPALEYGREINDMYHPEDSLFNFYSNYRQVKAETKVGKIYSVNICNLCRKFIGLPRTTDCPCHELDCVRAIEKTEEVLQRYYSNPILFRRFLI